MRKYQLEMRFHYLSENEMKQFTVYADSNSPWETVCAGFQQLLTVLQGCCGFPLPQLGRKEYHQGDN